MILDERETRTENVLSVARMMMTAARTAPKAKGVDIQEVVVVSGDELHRIADKMRDLSGELGMKFFLRDAENVDSADAMLLVGTYIHTHSLNCGMCGFSTCADKSRHETIPCAINSVDLGIALGSAVSLAADHRVDTRIMFSAGLSAKRYGILAQCHSVLAILLSSGSKNPFFDRVFEHK